MQEKIKFGDKRQSLLLRAAKTAFITASAISMLCLCLNPPAHAVHPTFPEPCHPTEYKKNWDHNFIRDVKSDFSTHFESKNLIFLGDSLLVAGVLANTGLDRSFNNHWQNDIRSKGSNKFFKPFNQLGSLNIYSFPIYIATMSIGHLREHTLMGNVVYAWGYRSVRTYLLGAVQQVVLTHLLGGGRPCRGEDSKWQPFRYYTGVSGHAFTGAIPFIVAAQMSDPPLLKLSLYAISTLPAFARVNNQAHYLSQSFLGWILAFLSARSIYQSDLERSPTYQVGVYPRSDGAMLAAKLEF